jgi:cytochrome c2
MVASLLLAASAHAANTVPTDIQMPGTQPGEVAGFESPDKCANCHAAYNDANTIGEPQHEPVTGWRGGAMGNAGRDAIFWATVAVSEQDFDGSGDLCIRCHSTGGWYDERSTPTDGSGLAASDDDGVDCDACHSLANPDNTEYLGVMISPFTANCSDDPIVPAGTCESASEGYYGGGMLSIWDGGEKLGPYAETVARHKNAQSKFHRDVDYCGTCHDVSNPAVGDLAPNHGAQLTAPPVVSSGVLGGPVEDKAAFNNPPYAYGVIERTFSEYKSSAFPATRVGDFNSLPADLKTAGGSLDVTYQAAIMAAEEAQEHGGIAGDYADGTPRFFSCQSCHMRPVVSAGANKNDAEVLEDLPSHDHTGGNYWFADITKYQDNKGTLLFGGGLTAVQIEALGLGQQRAVGHLQQAASLQVSANILKVVNLTGHKLISGYPEGRRMWVNIKWYDAADVLLREDGAYGQIGATVSNPSGGPDVNVESILDLDGANTRIYEAHYAVTKEWAATIEALHGADFELNYDRLSGNVVCTVGDFLLDDNDPGKKDACKGDYLDTFHFTLNNYVSMDNRIPPYGMSYDIARKRNTLPAPVDQYGGGGSGSVYNYWDEIALNPPLNADHARIELLYQGTSWEYIQFLNLANKRQNEFLGQEGINMLDAWLNATTAMDPLQRTMVSPIVMASVEWIGEPVSEDVIFKNGFEEQ